MSDLANSCEYLTIEKTCSAVSDSGKARASRQLRCRNEEQTTCCYLCSFRRECVINCKFLGNMGNEVLNVEAKKSEVSETVFKDKKTEVPQTENVPVTCCFLCNVEMSQNRTQFRINGWAGQHQKLTGDDSSKLVEEMLSVIVYLCPKCGKIELRADEKINNN